MFADLFEDRKRQQPESVEVGPRATALDLLEAVYRDPAQELYTRIRCAIACLPFQSPKLLATAIVSDSSFAELLDRRLERMKLIEDKQTITPEITTSVEEAKPAPTLPAPLTQFYSNRFRRRV